ncbi:MAG: nicotinate-nucleotide adenylyltransferase [bacterium]
MNLPCHKWQDIFSARKICYYCANSSPSQETGYSWHSQIKWGILGGTFNPIHNGHLIIAKEIQEIFSLEKILFIPSANPPHKKIEIIDKSHRFNMVKLAISSNPNFSISDIEMKKSGKSYSIETIQKLKKKYPVIDFYFIIGIDAFLEIFKWKKALKLISICNFIVINRQGYKLEDISEKVKKQVIIQEISNIDISSSKIRTLIKNKKSIKYLVPEKVEQYIEIKGIYQNEK